MPTARGSLDNARVDLLGLTAEELRDAARERLASGAGAWSEIHADAVLRGRFAPEDHGLNERSCAEWRAHFSLTLPEVVRTTDEPDARGTTIKAVLKTHDDLEIECVRIPMGGGRYTLCVSSQVGCKLACAFCETGRMGLLRNLSVSEIVAQVVVAQTALGWPIKNIVFMGMGEPLDNADHMLHALRVFADRRGLSYSQQRMTVCTAGNPDGLRRLGALRWPRLNVSVSLNAAFDDKRDTLMPINRKHPLAKLQAALVDYPRRKNFVYAVNYCLLPDFNDTREDARAVAEFCAPIGRVLVNVIPYNPGSAPLTRAPTDEEVDRFCAWLQEDGLPVRRRVTKGRSVMAACGQLGNVDLRRRRRLPVVDGEASA
ncbi:MAG: 23S rRNA (adenine(2503)-C(2))-methyltransferase RlmN [Deltaproteobacteria bacterium]